MKRTSVATALVLALGLAGCQTAMMPGADPFVMSNEPAYVGRAHFERGNYANAEQSFRTAVERVPGDVTSWLGLAASYDQLGRFDLADRAYTEAFRQGGRSFEAVNNHGYSHLLRGDFARARTLFQEAQRLQPDSPVAANNLALVDELASRRGSQRRV